MLEITTLWCTTMSRVPKRLRNSLFRIRLALKWLTSIKWELGLRYSNRYNSLIHIRYDKWAKNTGVHSQEGWPQTHSTLLNHHKQLKRKIHPTICWWWSGQKLIICCIKCVGNTQFYIVWHRATCLVWLIFRNGRKHDVPSTGDPSKDKTTVDYRKLQQNNNPWTPRSVVMLDIHFSRLFFFLQWTSNHLSGFTHDSFFGFMRKAMKWVTLDFICSFSVNMLQDYGPGWKHSLRLMRASSVPTNALCQ